MYPSFIIQARVGSSRLPNKILRPFYDGKSILELLIEKLQSIPESQIIIATSANSDNNIIEEFCKLHNVKCYRGSENDVLRRFIDAAEFHNIKNIIRICSDNPFLELESIKKLISKSQESDADYISFKVNGNPSIKTHFGFWTEYVTLDALKRVHRNTEDKLYHEHVTNYIYSHPENFKIEWIEGPECLNGRNDIRMTCDTINDFENLQKIYEDVCETSPYPSIKDIVHYLDSHDEYLKDMKEQIKQNTK